MTLENEEAGALGAALQGLWAFRNEKTDKVSIVELADRYIKVCSNGACEPDADTVQRYDDIYANYLQFNKTMYG